MRHVIDANVFIHGRRPKFDDMVTVPEVMEELRSLSGERSFSVTDIAVKEPTNHALNAVNEKAEEICSPTSEVDNKLLALASDEGGSLVTDDKALQNLALHLEVEFEGFIEDKVEKKVAWEMVCPSCGRKLKKRCPSCGKEPIRRRA